MVSSIELKKRILNLLYSPDCVDETDWAIQLSDDTLNKVAEYLKKYVNKNGVLRTEDEFYLIFHDVNTLSIFYDPEFHKFLFQLHNWVGEEFDNGFVHVVDLPDLADFVESKIHDDKNK